MWIFYILGFIINYKLLSNFQLNTKELLIVAIIGGIISFIISLILNNNKFITSIISFVVEVISILGVLKLEELYIRALDGIVHQNHFSSLIEFLLEFLIILPFFIAPFFIYSVVLAPQLNFPDKKNRVTFDKIDSKNNLINNKLNSKVNVNHIEEYMYTSFSEKVIYLYDKNLNIIQKEPQFIWLNNEEKDIYLKDLIDELLKYTNVSIENGKIRLNQSIGKNILSKCNEGIEIHRKKSKLNEFIKLLETRFSYYIEQYDAAIIGKEGEENVNNYLNLYDNFYNIPNVRFEINDLSGEKQSIESDNIIISKYGVYILEVKNLSRNGKYDIIIERDGRWLKRYKNGNVVSMKNATEQNNRHIVYFNRLINSALNRKMDDYIEAEGVVIIANNTVNIYNNSENQKIFRLVEFYPFLKNQNIMLSQQEMDSIKDIIIKNQLTSSKFPIYDYRFEIKNNYDNFCEYIQIEDYTVDIRDEEIN